MRFVINVVQLNFKGELKSPSVANENTESLTLPHVLQCKVLPIC